MSAAALSSVEWIHGAPDCTRSTDPLIQVYRFDEDTFILRISKCFSFEGNFLFLLFGRERAILLDTGGPADPVSPFQVLPLRETIDALIAQWLRDRGCGGIDLIVAHTHSHHDHAFWDGQFENRPRTRVVEPELDAVKNFFGLPDWPNGQAILELGGRQLLVLPLPGHEATHIAVYDERNKMLLTGDTLYPGRLTVQFWPDFRRSAARLAAFVSENEVSLVLGNHIEMKMAPGELFEIPATYQPNERVLPLMAKHVAELHAACEAMANAPRYTVLDDFVIAP